MKDITAILESMERQRPARSEVANVNKETIFDALSEDSLHLQLVTSGGGDHGAA
jgi:hypothetical protein